MKWKTRLFLSCKHQAHWWEWTRINQEIRLLSRSNIFLFKFLFKLTIWTFNYALKASWVCRIWIRLDWRNHFPVTHIYLFSLKSRHCRPEKKEHDLISVNINLVHLIKTEQKLKWLSGRLYTSHIFRVLAVHPSLEQICCFRCELILNFYSAYTYFLLLWQVTAFK